jgi:hypothetical protein
MPKKSKKAQGTEAALSAADRVMLRECRDPTTPLGRIVEDRIANLVKDLGGADESSYVLISEVRDFVALDLIMEHWRAKLTEGESVSASTLCQVVNTKLGLARLLGLVRRPKRVRGTLHDLMNGSNVTPIRPAEAKP